MTVKFVPFNEAKAPNIVVDGSPNRNTVLTLSHWPKSGTPWELKADTSAEIAFKYLDTPRFHVTADQVTNNHFDQDGLVGLFALIDPTTARRHRELLIDVATAGDFDAFKTRDAARIAFTLAAFAEAETSPFPSDVFDLAYPEMAAQLHVRTLDVFPRLIENVDEFRSYWEAEDQSLSAGEELIGRGIVTIEDRPNLDLAIVRAPQECHISAIYNKTLSTRILLLQGQKVELRYRYEGWIQLVSRKPAARVDLSALAADLNRDETGRGRWQCDSVDALSPRLQIGGGPTSIPTEEIVSRVDHYLQTTTASWNPYDK